MQQLGYVFISPKNNLGIFVFYPYFTKKETKFQANLSVITQKF